MPRSTQSARPEKRYYRIGEVSRLTGIKPYVLRYWESEFRWMAPAKSRSQQRLYRQSDIDTILRIKKLLKEERFTIKGARKKLRELGAANAAGERKATPRSRVRTELRKIHRELQDIRAML